MLSQLDLVSKGQGHSNNQKTMPQGEINIPSAKNEQGFCPITGCCFIKLLSYASIYTCLCQ